MESGGEARGPAAALRDNSAAAARGVLLTQGARSPQGARLLRASGAPSPQRPALASPPAARCAAARLRQAAARQIPAFASSRIKSCRFAGFPLPSLPLLRGGVSKADGGVFRCCGSVPAGGVLAGRAEGSGCWSKTKEAAQCAASLCDAHARVRGSQPVTCG